MTARGHIASLVGVLPVGFLGCSDGGDSDGERRAYLTWLDDVHYPGKIVNIEVVDGALVIAPSGVSVPGDD